MYPYIVCYCGRSIGDLFDVFKAMRNELYMTTFGHTVFDPSMLAIMPDLQVELGEVLDNLHLHLDCCRARMLTQVEFKELY